MNQSFFYFLSWLILFYSFFFVIFYLFENDEGKNLYYCALISHQPIFYSFFPKYYFTFLIFSWLPSVIFNKKLSSDQKFFFLFIAGLVLTLELIVYK